MELQLIQNKIYEIRGHKVMLDFDLAELYEVKTKALNQAVKRNLQRFPIDFMFRLTSEEWEDMRSQIVTAYQNKLPNITLLRSSLRRGTRKQSLRLLRLPALH